MQTLNAQGKTVFVNLRAAYQAAWRCYSAEVDRWQSLQAEPQRDGTSIHEAETAAIVAEEQYRRARNVLADYMLLHLSREAPIFRDEGCSELQCPVQPFQNGQSACFNHA